MLDSLLDQDIAPEEYEIIVVDDGSEEDPVALKEYIRRYPQISYHRIDHAGLSPARNFGLSMASGDWIYFCDSDDFIQSQVLGNIIKVAEDRQLEMISVRVNHIKPSDQLLPPVINFSMVSETIKGIEYIDNPQIPFSWGVFAYLLRRSVIESNNLSFRSIFYVEDRQFLLELLPCVSRFANIDVDLYYYVQNEDSILHSRKKHDRTEFAPALMTYIEGLSTFIQNPSIPQRIKEYLHINERIRWSYSLLTHVFRYYPVKTTIDAINSLQEMSIYPLDDTCKKISSRRIKLVNNKNIFIFLCRLYHLVPAKVRMKL